MAKDFNAPLNHQREVAHNAHAEQEVSVGNWAKGHPNKLHGGVLVVNPGGIRIDRNDGKRLIVYHVDPECLMWQAIGRLQASGIIDVLGAEDAGNFIRMAREIVTQYKRKG